MKKLKHILLGWCKALGLLPVAEAEKKLSELRLQICGRCPLAEVYTPLKIVNGRSERVQTLFCTRCTCPCKQKTLVVNETCPEGKW